MLERVQEGGTLLQTTVVTMTNELATRIVASWIADATLKAIIDALQAGNASKKHYV